MMKNVWFSSEDHSNNFNTLLDRFNAHNNSEYASACYVVAHPEVYRKIDWKSCNGPIAWYWGEWIGDDENGHWTESEIVGQLSSAYRGLVRAAVELYTGSQHYFDLMSWLGNAGDEVYKLFIQALEIRRDRSVVELRRKELKQCQTCHDFEGETNSYEYLEVRLCKNRDGKEIYLCEECIDSFARLKPGSFQVVRKTEGK